MSQTATVTRLDHFPSLAEMGITRFHEISHYTLRQEGASQDILKVYYRRTKGSLLPESRKYKFGRSLKTVVADGGSARLEDTHEISPFLLRAISELDSLVAQKDATVDTKTRLLSELDHLERVMANKVAELRKQIDSL